MVTIGHNAGVRNLTLTAPTVCSEPVAHRTQTLVPSVGVATLMLTSPFPIVTFINVYKDLQENFNPFKFEI